MNKHPAPPARPSSPAVGSNAKASASAATKSAGPATGHAARERSERESGTARIQGPDGLRLPDPHLPLVPAGAAPEKKPVAKPAEKKPEPYVRVPSAHIIAGLATSSAQNRLVRLQSLARRNRDVAWALEQIKSKSSSSSSSSKPKTSSDRQS